MSRIPPALARRVDRLARRAHAFHRWAHHPLCSWYAAEVIRVGRRTRICLGCALTGLGAVAGIVLGLAAPAMPGALTLGAGALLLAVVPEIVRRPSTPRPQAAATLRANGAHARRFHRARKLLTRFLPTAVAGFLVAQAVHAPSPAGLGAAALAAGAVGWTIARYRRRGPDRSACQGCPDGPPGARCPGLAPIARRERALSRLAGRWIAARPETGGGAAHCSGAPWGARPEAGGGAAHSSGAP